MAETSWTMIRVRRETADRLKSLITAALTRGGALGHPKWLEGQELTLDRMIARLIDHVDRDRARSRKWSKKRQGQQLVSELELLDRVYTINPAFEEAECTPRADAVGSPGRLRK